MAMRKGRRPMRAYAFTMLKIGRMQNHFSDRG
jgi:hypothetical protein